MRCKLLPILNSETVTFCENVCITIRGIAFTPSNQLSYTTSFSPNHSAFKRDAKSVPYVPDSNRLSSPSFLYFQPPQYIHPFVFFYKRKYKMDGELVHNKSLHIFYNDIQIHPIFQN